MYYVNYVETQVHKERGELTPLYTNAGDTGTLRLIIAFFSGFTLTLTIALGVQIYYGKSQVCTFSYWLIITVRQLKSYMLLIASFLYRSFYTVVLVVTMKYVRI